MTGRALLALAIAAVPASGRAEPAHQVRVDLGVAAPAGQAALRYRIEPQPPTGLIFEAGVGLAYTGLALSLVLAQPLGTIDEGTPGATRLFGYGGYSIGILRDSVRHPLAAESRFVPDGEYHWVDAGVMMERGWSGLVIAGGLGLGVLVRFPERPALMPDDDATFVTPEWWLDKRLAPSLWAGVGWRF